ncbi:hypothetical protein MTsDn1_12380 [Alteromonas sp. MTD1]|uniref:hypothetical protein n=1 Tax=Alteromonas sp. MTD1 TaxID=3057962 RepID=UPI0036F211BC
MQFNLSRNEVIKEIVEADSIVSDSDFYTLKTWLKYKIEPVQWQHEQYEFDDKFWVVVLLNQNCLYFNFIEEGWGWGKFSENGFIEKYHWEQDKLYEAFLWRYKDKLYES